MAPVLVWKGNLSGAMKLRRLTSAGSMPISAANRSTARSTAAVASGRPAEFPGRPGDGDRVSVDADLGAEPAAHVGHHHADLVGRDAQGAGQDEPAHLRVLRAGPDGQLAVLEAGGRGPALHR